MAASAVAVYAGKEAFDKGMADFKKATGGSQGGNKREASSQVSAQRVGSGFTGTGSMRATDPVGYDPYADLALANAAAQSQFQRDRRAFDIQSQRDTSNALLQANLASAAYLDSRAAGDEDFKRQLELLDRQHSHERAMKERDAHVALAELAGRREADRARLAMESELLSKRLNFDREMKNLDIGAQWRLAQLQSADNRYLGDLQSHDNRYRTIIPMTKGTDYAYWR